MDQFEFKAMANNKDQVEVLAMMGALYREDPASSPPDPGRFPLTIQHFLQNPARGRIMLFLEQHDIRGYAIVIPFWSNEVGGNVLFIDELFVKPPARGRSIGRQFLESLARERPFDSIAASLEVSPANERARRLYESIGFRARRNVHFTYVFPEANGR